MHEKAKSFMTAERADKDEDDRDDIHRDDTGPGDISPADSNPDDINPDDSSSGDFTNGHGIPLPDLVPIDPFKSAWICGADASTHSLADSQVGPSHQVLFPADAFLSGLTSGADDLDTGGRSAGGPSIDRPIDPSDRAALESDLAPLESEKKGTTPPLYAAIATSCIIAVVLAVLLRVFVAQAYEIRGKSMEPTLHDGEKVMILKLAPTVDALERGDLVIFRSPRDKNKDLIKRVVALAGDTFEIRRGDVFINGERVQEDYANHELYPRSYSSVVQSPVPKGSIVVLGDNRPNSQDSRSFGAVPLELVKGRVVLRWWPISEMTTSF